MRPQGSLGKTLCRQIEKNSAIKNAQSVLATARNRGLLTIFVNIGWRPGFPELPENQYYPLLQGAKDEKKASSAPGRSMSSMRCVRWRVSRS